MATHYFRDFGVLDFKTAVNGGIALSAVTLGEDSSSEEGEGMAFPAFPVPLNDSVKVLMDYRDPTLRSVEITVRQDETYDITLTATGATFYQPIAGGSWVANVAVLPTPGAEVTVVIALSASPPGGAVTRSQTVIIRHRQTS